MKFKFIPSGSTNTYYLQSVSNSNEYVGWKGGGWYLRIRPDGDDGYQKAAIKFTSSGSNTYTIVDAISGHSSVQFMEEDGKVFSDHDVDMSSGRNWISGVKLVEY